MVTSDGEPQVDFTEMVRSLSEKADETEGVITGACSPLRSIA